MRHLLVALGFLSVIHANAAQDQKRTLNPEGTAEFTEAKDGHRVRLVFTTKRFKPEQHTIAPIKNCVTIDGRRPLGTDCGVPKVEISIMRLFWDGKEVPLARHFYSDCYSPPYFEEYQKKGWMKQFLEIRFSDDTKALFVFLHAGDGAGVYDVVWVLRKNGSHTRFTDSGGDCSFLNFDCRAN
jgi:hypothetical protein